MISDVPISEFTSPPQPILGDPTSVYDPDVGVYPILGYRGLPDIGYTPISGTFKNIGIYGYWVL
jgi:hypothetical protein